MKQVRLGDRDVWALNATDAAMLHRQIFVEQSYAGHGIAVRDGDCVFDVGANIGLFSLWLTQRHSALKVHAFEPVPETFAALERNCPGHRLHPCALGERAGQAKLTYDPWVSSTATLEPLRPLPAAALAADLGVSRVTAVAIQLARRLLRRRVVCPVRTLDEIIAEHHVERIDLLKIDVEGAEARVLAGLSAWSRVRQVIVETHEPERIGGLLRAQGFSVQSDREAWRSFEALGLHNLYATRVTS